jgi:hypothetical protein
VKALKEAANPPKLKLLHTAPAVSKHQNVFDQLYRRKRANLLWRLHYKPPSFSLTTFLTLLMSLPAAFCHYRNLQNLQTQILLL